jgi:hypothetical protein
LDWYYFNVIAWNLKLCFTLNHHRIMLYPKALAMNWNSKLTVC